jgi:hypothetical protein
MPKIPAPKRSTDRTLTYLNLAELNAFNDRWHTAFVPTADASRLDSALALVAEKLGGSITPLASNLFEGKASLRIFDLAPWDSPLPSQIPIIIWLAESPPQGQEIEQLRHRLAKHRLTHPIAILIDLFEDSPARAKALLVASKKLQQVFI